MDETVGMMHELVEERIVGGGIADHLMPVLDGQLTRDERGAPPSALLDEFEETAPLALAEGREVPTIEDEQIDLGHRLHQLAIGGARPRH